MPYQTAGVPFPWVVLSACATLVWYLTALTQVLDRQPVCSPSKATVIVVLGLMVWAPLVFTAVVYGGVAASAPSIVAGACLPLVCAALVVKRVAAARRRGAAVVTLHVHHNATSESLPVRRELGRGLAHHWLDWDNHSLARRFSLRAVLPTAWIVAGNGAAAQQVDATHVHV